MFLFILMSKTKSEAMKPTIRIFSSLNQKIVFENWKYFFSPDTVKWPQIRLTFKVNSHCFPQSR